MSLSDSRRGPVYLSRATGLTAQNAATTTVLSCCVIVPLVACQCHYPGGTEQVRLLSTWSAAAFPNQAVGRLPQLAFSGPAQQFTRVLARRLAELLRQSFDAKGFRRLVPSQSTSAASWCTTSSRYGSCTHGNNHTFPRRTPEASATDHLIPNTTHSETLS